MERVGKYQLLRKLATGGMAEVFLARAEGPMGFQKRLVVKRILPQFVEDPNFVNMFLAEAKLAAALDHPNLVQTFDFGVVDGQYYLAMEYIDGPNLRALNTAARRRGRPLSYAVASRLISSAAEGLHAAHELRNEQGELVHLVHRDISPDNLLVSRNGTVKIVDFGIAKVSSEPSRTKTGVIKGKLAYMPPEQLAREPLDRRTDVFALGVVLYELITGVMPFDATSEVTIIQAIMNGEPLERAGSRQPDVPSELDAIIAKCLEKNPDRRFASAMQLQQALEAFMAASGARVSISDLAQVVDDLVPASSDQVATVNQTGDDLVHPTVPSPQQHTGPRDVELLARTAEEVEVQTRRDAVVSVSSSRHVEPMAEAKPGVARRAMVAMLLAGLIGGGLGLFRAWQVRHENQAKSLPSQPPVGLPAEPVVVAPTPTVEIVPDAGPAPVAEPQVTPPVHVVKSGRLELRIRPFATVFIDGRRIGETPLPPVSMSAGKHRLRLVNEALNKRVEQDVVIRPGDTTVYKLNLKD